MTDILDLCEDGGHYHGGSCYQTISKCKSFDIANANCLVSGATLPVIESEEESLFIQERIKTATWLNLKKSSSSAQNNWQWGDGNPLNFTQWFPGQPADLPDHSCAVVDNRGIDSGWKVEHCSACRNTICEKGILFTYEICIKN